MIDPFTLHRLGIAGSSLAAKGQSPAAHPQSKLSGHHTYLKFAQGQDTDCYAELVGSVLGAYFGPGHFEERWLAPFNQGRLASTRTGIGVLLRAVVVKGGETDGRVAGTGCGCMSQITFKGWKTAPTRITRTQSGLERG
jgi:hypothetical protein